MDGGCVVGIDLGGTNMQVGVVRGGREVIGRGKRKTKAEKGAEGVLDRIAETVERAAEEAGIGMGDLEAVGIGVPGALDLERGVVLEAPNLRWRDVDVRSGLSSRLGGLPVTVDNDVNVAVWGEYVAGAGGRDDGETEMLGVWAGTGVGGGLVINGELYHGATGTAGEIGQTLLFPNAPLTFRKLEDVCSRTAVLRRVVHLVETNERSIVSELADEKGRGLRELGSGTLARAYEMGDEVVRDVVNEAADYLGRGIANYVTVLGLRRVVLGGGLTEAIGEAWVEVVGRSAREHVFPRAAGETLEVRATALEADAGVIGAAALAVEALGGSSGVSSGVSAGGASDGGVRA